MTTHIYMSQLPFPKQGIKNSKDHILQEDLHVEHWTIPKGTVVKLITTKNFGWCITPPLGNAKRIFKW